MLHAARHRQEAAFRQGLKAYQAAHRFQKAGTGDLRTARQSVSGKDLRPYFAAWVDGTTLPAPVTKRTGAASSGYATVVEVKAEGLPGPSRCRSPSFFRTEGTARGEPAPGGNGRSRPGVPVTGIGVNEDAACSPGCGGSGP